MEKVRVLIVDDAVLARKVIADCLSEDPAIEVIGFASNGRLALQRVAAAHPDLVILDLEMPEMNGLETIDAMRAQYPNLPIVMCSAYTDTGAEQTLEALSRGANDYVTKPSKSRDLEESRTKLRNELVPKIKALCGLTGERSSTPSTRARGTGNLPQVAVDVLAIGSSTGGPSALAEVLPNMGGDFPVPILITQHMPKLFTAFLAERLAAQSEIKVVEGSPGVEPLPGYAYIAPGGYHMVVKRDGERVVIDLNEEAPENSCRPSVDVMLRSIVDVYGKNILSLILTGMGQDGLRGCELVRRRGGIVLAQDEASSVVWGMPGAISSAGIAHAISPLTDIAPLVERLVKANRILRRGAKASEEQ